MTIPRLSFKSKYKLRKKEIGLITLAFAILLIIYFIPTPQGLPENGKLMIGILLFATVLWITEPIPLAVTSLLIMIFQPFLGILPAKDVFASFGNEAVFFLLGAFIIAGAMEKYGLNRRIALGFLRHFENNPSLFTLGIMISCAMLSFIMPNHGVAALFLPIIASILLAMKIIPRQSNFGKISLLAVAYGCSIGSLGTLIGGARNPLTISALADIGITVSFVDWMIYSMPVVFISLPIVWLILRFTYPIEIKDITLAKKEIENQVAKQGDIGKQEIIITLTLIFTIFMWVLFSNHIYFGLAAIAILGSSILFLTGILTWKDVEQKVPWGII
ncbi:MAG: DASS family sodium-coupled anion symporter, partial [Candidatus Heimdallarchaeota archaeon]|nr:DASS family sodium-coupled anion symporter [Candidatus Heimdallarchaeota archaeon]